MKNIIEFLYFFLAAQDIIFPNLKVEIALQFLTEPVDTVAVPGKPTKLNCSVRSNSEDNLSVYWTLNGTVVPRSGRRFVDRHSALVFKKVSHTMKKIVTVAPSGRN